MVLSRPHYKGAIIYRGRLGARLNGWRKRTPFNPYWLDWSSLRDSIRALVPLARGTLLDVGVSEGPYKELFAGQVERYVGLEYPPAVLDKQPDMWNVLQEARKSIDIFGDGRRLPFADDSFDTVLATEVLEHLEQPADALREMARVLKPGGRLLLTVPFSQPLHELPSDYWRFTPGSLAMLVRETGLEVEEVRPRGNFASVMGALSSQWLLRSFGSSRRNIDGSAVTSRWRVGLLLPVVAGLQIFFRVVSRFSNDQATALGYVVIARAAPSSRA